MAEPRMDPLDLFLCRYLLREMAESIFEYLDIGSLRTARCVSCLWKKFIDANLLSERMGQVNRRWIEKGPVNSFTSKNVLKYGYRAIDWKLNGTHVTYEFGDIYEDEMYLYVRPTAGYEGHYAPSVISNTLERYITKVKRQESFEEDEKQHNVLCALAVSRDYIIGLEMRSMKLHVWDKKHLGQETGQQTPVFETQYKPQFKKPDRNYTWAGDYGYFRSGCTLKIQHSQDLLIISPNFHVEIPQIWKIEASGQLHLLQHLGSSIPNIVHVSKPDHIGPFMENSPNSTSFLETDFPVTLSDQNPETASEDVLRYAMERSHRNIFDVSQNLIAWTVVTVLPSLIPFPQTGMGNYCGINANLELHIFANSLTPIVDTGMIKEEKRYSHKGFIPLTGVEFLTDSCTVAIHQELIIYLDSRQWLQMVSSKQMAPVISVGLHFFLNVTPSLQFVAFDREKIIVNSGFKDLFIFKFDELTERFADLKEIVVDVKDVENTNTLELSRHSDIKAVDLMTPGILRVVNNKKEVTFYHFDTSKR